MRADKLREILGPTLITVSNRDLFDQDGNDATRAARRSWRVLADRRNAAPVEPPDARAEETDSA